MLSVGSFRSTTRSFRPDTPGEREQDGHGRPVEGLRGAPWAHRALILLPPATIMTTLSCASTARTAEELRDAVAQLNDLITLAKSTRQKGPERKAEEFRKAIKSQTVADRNGKILVFTAHMDKLRYLTRLLRHWGYNACNIYGDMKLADHICGGERDSRPGPVHGGQRGGRGRY